MAAFLLVVLANAMSLVESTAIKQYNAKHTKGGFVFTAMVSLFSMLFFVITDKGGFHFPAEMLPYGLASGVLYASASLLTYIALGCGPFALSMLLLSYAGIFSILYGILFLGDTLSVFSVLGIVLMLVSLYLTRTEKRVGESKISFRWAIAIGISVAGCGMLGVLQKMQQLRFENTVDNEYMIVTLGFSAVSLFIIGCISDAKSTFHILKSGAPFFSLAGLSNGFTNFLVLVTNEMMPLSIVSPLRTGTKIVLSFLISTLVFKERFLPRQLVGVAVGTAALILLNF